MLLRCHRKQYRHPPVQLNKILKLCRDIILVKYCSHRTFEFIADKFEAGAEEFRLLQHLANQCRGPSTAISELVDDLNNFQTGS